ncbi:MAG: OmpA family protein [Cytophagaceae bacterium]|nr:OmpA family protein [Cytophagaceae bacterium]
MKVYWLFLSFFLVFDISAHAQLWPQDWMFSYAFDGNAKDEGPKANHGSIVGEVASATNRFEETGKALFFNGSQSGYIRIPFNNTLNLPLSNFTFSVWINLTDYQKTNYWDLVKSDQYAPIFCKAENEQFFQYRLCLTGQGYSFDGLKNGSLYGSFYANGAVVKKQQWQLLTVTYDTQLFRIYVDGKLKNTADFINNFQSDQNNLVIGRDAPGVIEYFNGYMDDFKVWTRALSVREVAELYEATSKKTEAIKETFEVNTGESIVLKNVLFVQSKTDLLPSSYPELEKLVETLNLHPAVAIEIAGHTDNQGERNKNIELSENRAKKTKEYLVEKGIEEKRISAVGYGPDNPLNTNRTETERKLNRRVEFKIMK